MSVRAKEARKPVAKPRKDSRWQKTNFRRRSEILPGSAQRFEATDRGLNDKARGHIRRHCGRPRPSTKPSRSEKIPPTSTSVVILRLAIAPPNAPHLLHDVLRHRQSVQRHHEHREQLNVLSAQIDKQELRKFYFVIFSIFILLGVVLLLVFQSPPKREWLPRETDAILSLNAERFDRDDLPKKWRNEDFWLQTWPGLIGAASQTPRLRIPADTSRVTRALTTAENSPPREFLLVEARDNISSVVRTIAEDKQFEKRTISGLPVWQRSDFSIARVGPKTLAVGLPDGVDELVRVRLGLDADLDITGEFFDRFQALDSETTLRLISRDPPGLVRVFHPIFPRELLDRAQMLGLGVSLQTPAKARLLLRLSSEDAASDLAKSIHENPHRGCTSSNLISHSSPLPLKSLASMPISKSASTFPKIPRDFSCNASPRPMHHQQRQLRIDAP